MAVNDQILDASISHQVALQYYSNSVVNRMIATINRVDADLGAELTKALERLPQDSFTVQRLDAVLADIRRLNAELYATISDDLENELKELVRYEASFQKSLYENTIPVQISFTSINAEQVYAAALSRPFQGKLLKEWMAGLEQDKAVRIRDAIRIGYVENQTLSQIVQRVRGTRAFKYKDGILDINTRNAETIVRTAIGHMAGFARDRFHEANQDVIKAVQWVSTLDGRTTEICRARDNKLYTPVTHKPIGHSLKWLGGAGNAHFGCRSASVGVTKSWRELGFDIDEIPAGTRASMTGQVPADMSYADWLKNKDASFQDDVLGKAKGKLFRSGMPIERFSNNLGKSYNLEQLKEREAYYFKKSGL